MHFTNRKNAPFLFFHTIGDATAARMKGVLSTEPNVLAGAACPLKVARAAGPKLRSLCGLAFEFQKRFVAFAVRNGADAVGVGNAFDAVVETCAIHGRGM